MDTIFTSFVKVVMKFWDILHRGTILGLAGLTVAAAYDGYKGWKNVHEKNIKAAEELKAKQALTKIDGDVEKKATT